MGQPANRAAWWPVAVAALLLALAGSWLGNMLPAVPRLQLPAEAPAVDSTASQLQDVPPLATAPTYEVPSDEVSDSCWTGPLRFERGSLAARRPLLLRHYVGTVGGQPSSVLLQWQHPDSVTGTGYLHQRGPVFALVSARSRSGSLILDVWQENPVEGNAGEWHLTREPKGRLRGTWRDGPGGKPQAIILRESYAGAIRLALETTYLRGGWAIPGYIHCINVPTVSHEFLSLLAPATVPLGLQPLLAPDSAVRRRATLALREGDAQVEASVSVRLNDWNLLSYQTLYATSPYAGRTQYVIKGSPLLDLAAGRAWPLGRLLQARFQTPLKRLVANHLLHDAKYEQYIWSWSRRQLSTLANDTSLNSVLWLRRELVPRPETYVFTSEGLELLYWPQNLADTADSKWLTTVLIPYRELRPLMRPRTPLARMLQARGMW